MAIDGLKGIFQIPFIKREKEGPQRRKPGRKKKDERSPAPGEQEETVEKEAKGKGRVDIKV